MTRSIAMISMNNLKLSLKNSLIPLFFVALAFALCFPLLKDLQLSCRGDWDYFSALHEVSSLTIFEYRQFPLWNPYVGGGISLIGNPQSGFPSPIFLVTGLFGVFAGLKIAIWLHTALGLWGMWLLAGHFGLKGPARLAPAVIFIFSSAWALHLTEGHMVWLPVAFLPLFFLTFLKGLRDKRWLVLAGVVESLMFYEGATYVFAYSVLFVALYALCYSLECRRWQPLFANLGVNILAAALSAPKLLPMLELLGSNPRPVSAGSPLAWDDILAALVERSSGGWETGNYLGFTVVILFLLSFSLFRQQLSLILTSIFMLMLSMGDFAPYSPWNILHKLPLFGSFHVPTRVFVVFNFSVALLVGIFLGQSAKSSDRRVNFILWVVVLFIGSDLFLLSHSVFGEAAKTANISVRRDNFKAIEIKRALYRVAPAETTGLGRSVASVHQPFSQIRVPDLARFVHGAYSDQYLPIVQNQGVVDAYEPINFGHNARAVTDKDYQGEYYLSGAGELKLLRWSPNKLSFHVTLPESGRLLINQNFSSGWHASRGSVANVNGLLGVDLPAGEHDVTVHYLPYSFLLGLAVAATTILGAWVFVRKSRPSEPGD